MAVAVRERTAGGTWSSSGSLPYWAPSACPQDRYNGGDVYTPGACYCSVVFLYHSGDEYRVCTSNTAAVDVSSDLPGTAIRTWYVQQGVLRYLLVCYHLGRMYPYCVRPTSFAYFYVLVPSPTAGAVTAAVYCDCWYCCGTARICYSAAFRTGNIGSV